MKEALSPQRDRPCPKFELVFCHKHISSAFLPIWIDANSTPPFLSPKLWGHPWPFSCPCSLSSSHPYAPRTSSPLRNYAGSTFRVPRICHLLWQVLPDYNLNHHNRSSVLPLTPLSLVSTQQPEGTFQMLSHIMLADHKTLQWLWVKKPRSLQWSSSVSLSLAHLLLLTSFPSLLPLSFSLSLSTLALLLLASKAHFRSFRSLIKCLYVNKACGNLPVQLYSVPPCVHPDPFLPCSFSNQPSNILTFEICCSSPILP